MKKNLLLFFLVIFLMNNGYSQNKTMWSPLSEKEIESSPKVRRASFPQEYTLWKLDIVALKEKLRNAPIRGQFTHRQSNIVIQLPNAEGKLEQFRVLETPIMEPDWLLNFQQLNLMLVKELTMLQQPQDFQLLNLDCIV